VTDALGRTPDGTDAAVYDWLSRLDRPGWAWEWLRRDPGYAGGKLTVDVRPRINRIPKGAGDPDRGLLFRGRSYALRA